MQQADDFRHGGETRWKNRPAVQFHATRLATLQSAAQPSDHDDRVVHQIQLRSGLELEGRLHLEGKQLGNQQGSLAALF